MGWLGVFGLVIAGMGWLGLLFLSGQGGGEFGRGVFNLHSGMISQSMILSGLLLLVFDGLKSLRRDGSSPREAGAGVSGVVSTGLIGDRPYREYADGRVIVDTKYGQEEFSSLRAARKAF